ncbi:MAG: GDP-mannose 4,6-dehydratase [Proteobacteria bacterium]|nr:GDP-mannose 4,6-dehydratase [Pseudomonadota bacterium]
MATVITGITGQDGPYLAKLLLEKGETVFGAFRRTSTTDFWRLRKLGIADHPNLHLIEHDLTDPASSIRLLEKSEATHVYNLAAQSFVGVSFEQPVATANITGLGAVHLLEAIRVVNSEIRYYQASTSEMFGKVQQSPQNETTPFYPRSPYGIAKLYAHWMTVNYREAYGIFGVSGILFNHESPLRGKEFVTRKITDAVARIKLEKQKFLELGNLDAKRDWGFAGDFVEGIYRMLNADTPDTYVLATGRAATVREFVSMACAAADIAIVWEGSGLQEVGIDENTGNKIIGVNPDYFRPTDVDCLCGDFSKAKEQLGWEPKTSLNQLCEMMVYADLAQHSK